MFQTILSFKWQNTDTLWRIINLKTIHLDEMTFSYNYYRPRKLLCTCFLRKSIISCLLFRLAPVFYVIKPVTEFGKTSVCSLFFLLLWHHLKETSIESNMLCAMADLLKMPIAWLTMRLCTHWIYSVFLSFWLLDVNRWDWRPLVVKSGSLRGKALY